MPGSVLAWGSYRETPELREIRRGYGTAEARNCWLAEVAGEIDAALDWYQKDIELHRPNAPMIAFAGWLQPLRERARWARVAGMMNLPISFSAVTREPSVRRNRRS